MNLTERIPLTRKRIKAGILGGFYEAEKLPSRLWRMATNPTKSPFDFAKAKKRRKMVKASRRKNRK
mgnify:CR=1 FL=1